MNSADVFDLAVIVLCFAAVLALAFAGRPRRRDRLVLRAGWVRQHHRPDMRPPFNHSPRRSRTG